MNEYFSSNKEDLRILTKVKLQNKKGTSNWPFRELAWVISLDGHPSLENYLEISFMFVIGPQYHLTWSFFLKIYFTQKEKILSLS